MALKKFKPITPSMRQLILIDRSELYKGRPEKSLTTKLTKNGGRNNLGRITVHHKGGGHKKLYRLVDFRRTKDDIGAIVERIEYDPNRSAFIALIKYDDGELSYIIAPRKMQIGDKVISSELAEIIPGNCMLAKSVPVGTMVHNIEMKPGGGAKLARSAGCYAQIVGKDGRHVQIRLSSGEFRLIEAKCRVTIGAVSNPDKKNIKLAKAGRTRWMGVRPTVRGTAMNPVDHKHGGGEGKNFGVHPVTPWGIATKGKKTRKKNKLSNKMIIKRRK